VTPFHKELSGNDGDPMTYWAGGTGLGGPGIGLDAVEKREIPTSTRNMIPVNR
jgi:hypothetical protein